MQDQVLLARSSLITPIKRSKLDISEVRNRLKTKKKNSEIVQDSASCGRTEPFMALVVTHAVDDHSSHLHHMHRGTKRITFKCYFSSFRWRLIFLVPLPARLLRGEPERMKSGIGGVILRPGGEGVRVRRSVKLWECMRGLLRVARLSERIRLVGREMTCPLSGEAITTVPGVAAGGGVGLSVLKRGWI